MITKEKIDRINELAHKAKSPEGLTPEEIEERDILRREYIDAFKENLRAQLDNIKFVDEEGCGNPGKSGEPGKSGKPGKLS